jgi:hypothetical protein
MINGLKSISLKLQKMLNLCAYVGAVPPRKLLLQKSSKIAQKNGSHVSVMEGMTLQ